MSKHALRTRFRNNYEQGFGWIILVMSYENFGMR